MGKTMKSGFGKSTQKRSPMAPTMAGGMPQGVVGGSPSAAPQRGKLVKKGNRQSGEPAGATQSHRIQNFERHGAQHRVTVPMRITQVPEAAPTQANGKVIKSYPKLQDSWSGGDFWDAQHGG